MKNPDTNHNLLGIQNNVLGKVDKKYVNTTGRPSTKYGRPKNYSRVRNNVVGLLKHYISNKVMFVYIFTKFFV